MPPRTRPQPSRTRPVRPRRRRPKTSARTTEHIEGQERLQKILASAGLGSRRQCEELIEQGRVEVGRKVVSELGAKADPERDEIRVDGVALTQPKLLHFMMNKPKNVVSTNSDPAGRTRIIDLLPPELPRLFTVGRLDMSSEGLILITNDGELANKLTHPRYGVEKTYQVEVAGSLDRDALAKLKKGVHLAEGFAHVVNVRIKSQHKQSTTLEIVLDEGRNREVRRLLARVGHKVMRLKRIAIGPLRLGELPSGSFRPLTREERRDLRAAAEGNRKRDEKSKDHKPEGRGPKKPAAAKLAPSKPARPAAAPPIEPEGPDEIEVSAHINAAPPQRGLGRTVIGDVPTKRAARATRPPAAIRAKAAARKKVTGRAKRK
jgi:23S rRNA pseudouridine2605 synthase